MMIFLEINNYPDIQNNTNLISDDQHTQDNIENHDFVAMLTIIDASSNMTRCIRALNPFVIAAF